MEDVFARPARVEACQCDTERFLVQLHHTLRTPATVVMGAAKTLFERWEELSDEDRKMLVRVACRGSEDLGTALDDLPRSRREVPQQDINGMHLRAMQSRQASVCRCAPLMRRRGQDHR